MRKLLLALFSLALSLGAISAARAATAYVSEPPDTIFSPTGGEKLIAQLNVPAGTYLVNAKLAVVNKAALAAAVNCRLSTGGLTDFSSIPLMPNTSGVLINSGAARLSAAGGIYLSCTALGANVNVTGIRLSALAVDKLVGK